MMAESVCVRGGEKLEVCLNLCCAILRSVCVFSSQKDNWGPQAFKLRRDERLMA